MHVWGRAPSPVHVERSSTGVSSPQPKSRAKRGSVRTSWSSRHPFDGVIPSAAGFQRERGNLRGPPALSLHARSPFDALTALACSGQALGPLVKARDLRDDARHGTCYPRLRRPRGVGQPGVPEGQVRSLPVHWRERSARCARRPGGTPEKSSSAADDHLPIFNRPSGTRLNFDDGFPALKRRAIFCRPDGTYAVVFRLPGTHVPGCRMPPLRGSSGLPSFARPDGRGARPHTVNLWRARRPSPTRQNQGPSTVGIVPAGRDDPLRSG